MDYGSNFLNRYILIACDNRSSISIRRMCCAEAMAASYFAWRWRLAPAPETTMASDVKKSFLASAWVVQVNLLAESARENSIDRVETPTTMEELRKHPVLRPKLAGDLVDTFAVLRALMETDEDGMGVRLPANFDPAMMSGEQQQQPEEAAVLCSAAGGTRPEYVRRRHRHRVHPRRVLQRQAHCMMHG